MASTLEAFAGSTSQNYCTLPTIDVEVLPSVRHCETCAAPVTFDPRIGHFGAWKHTSAETPDHGRIAPKSQCAYCHSEDDVTFTQHAWFDAVECARCGGITGFAVGD